MVLLLGFPDVPDPYSWIVGSQVFWSLFCIIRWLIGTYLSLFFVFLSMPPWTILIPTWPFYSSRGSQAPKNPKYPGPVFSLSSPVIFLTFEGWAGLFSFLCFMSSKACLSMDLGPSLWTLNGFGPSPFFYWKPNFFFLDFNPICCFGPWHNIVIFWTSTLFNSKPSFALFRSIDIPPLSLPSFSFLSYLVFTFQPNEPFWLHKKQKLTKPKAL